MPNPMKRINLMTVKKKKKKKAIIERNKHFTFLLKL